MRDLPPGVPAEAPGPAEDPGPPAGAAWLGFVALVGAVTILGASGVLPRWAGLVHAVAPPPLDLSFDLRVLVARAPSWAAFVAGAAASVSLRALLLATLLPSLGVRLSFARRVRRAFGFYALASVPLAAGAGLEFAGLASVYSWYAWAGLGVIVLTALAMMPRLLGRSGWIGATPLIVSGSVIVGILARSVSEAWVPAIVPLSGALTAFALSHRSRSRPPAIGAGALALLVALPAFGMAAAPAQLRERPPILFLVPGVDTSTGHGAMYRFQPAAVGFPCDRVFYYSYRGPGPDQPSGEAPCAIRIHEPYVAGDTQRPLAELVDAFGRQIAAIRADTKRAPIVVVTHSQGAVIAWAAAASDQARGVTHLIALGGFPHSPVGYPAPGEDGEGRVGADVLRLLSAATRRLSSGTFSPDAPLAREILSRPDGLEGIFARSLPSGVAVATISTAFDVIAAPEGSRIAGASGVRIDATHVGVVESEEAYGTVRAFLRADPLPADSLLAGIVDAVVHAFMPPPAGS